MEMEKYIVNLNNVEVSFAWFLPFLKKCIKTTFSRSDFAKLRGGLSSYMSPSSLSDSEHCTLDQAKESRGSSSPLNSDSMIRSRKRRALDSDFEDNEEILHPRLMPSSGAVDDDIAASSDEAAHGREDNSFESDFDKDYNGNRGRKDEEKEVEEEKPVDDVDEKDEKYWMCRRWCWLWVCCTTSNQPLIVHWSFVREMAAIFRPFLLLLIWPPFCVLFSKTR